MIFIMSREEKDLLKQLRSLKALDDVSALQAETIALKKKVTDLEIQRSQKQEEWDRGDRELRHMIGLEKKRQEQEIVLSRREAVQAVKEEALAADKQRFSDEMAFQRKRFEEEVGYLKGMVGQVLERLPNVNMEIHKGPVLEVKHSGG